MLEEIIALYPSDAAFRRAVGIKYQQHLTQIKNGKRPIPVAAAIAINKLHGVPLHDMRPKVFPA